MKIALCLEYPIQQQGGTEAVVRELLAGLAPHHEMLLVSPDDTDSLHKSSIGSLISKHIPWNPLSVGRKPAQALAAALEEAGVDVAHFHFGGNFGWGSRLFRCSPIPHVARRGIRVFSTVHSVVDVLTGYCGPQKPWLFKLALLPAAWFGKMDVLAHVQCEFAVSRHDYKLLARWYWPLRSRLAHIYHSRLGGEAIADNGGPREKLILCVGHLAHRKGQHVLVQAFARIAAKHPDWSLALVGHAGGDKAEKHLRELIRSADLGDRVQLTGPSDRVPEWLRKASIYVQPSLEEALGLALQEAMAGGCACIGSRVGGIPELIEPGTGLLVEPANVPELSQALDHLIENERQRETLGRAAALSIPRRGMTRAAMVSQYLQYYG